MRLGDGLPPTGADLNEVRRGSAAYRRPQEGRRTELRLEHKRSKRDLTWSETNLLAVDERYVLSSPNDFRARRDWLRLDTTDLTADATCELIMQELGLYDCM